MLLHVAPPSPLLSTEYDVIGLPLSFGWFQLRTTFFDATGCAVSPVGASGESAIVTLAVADCAPMPASLTVATL